MAPASVVATSAASSATAAFTTGVAIASAAKTGLGVLAGGLALGVAFNPVASLVGAPLAAGLFGSPKAKQQRLTWAVCVLALAWLVGDGFRVMARLRDVLDRTHALTATAAPAAIPWQPFALLTVWALAALAVGYAVPAALGAYVGRRVVKGTGWLSAAAVAAMCSGALTVLAVPVSAALAKWGGG